MLVGSGQIRYTDSIENYFKRQDKESIMNYDMNENEKRPNLKIQGSMRKRMLSFMKEYDMTALGGQILIGLSGGADSVCLLHLLNSVKDELSVRLFAVHVHHGLRGGEADRDARFSEELCERLSIPFKLVHICAAKEAEEAGLSIEEAGRQARYRIFAHEADGLKAGGGPVRIATAHHGDDSAETILFHLFRGSGLKGLGGIAPVRGMVIRPLLWADRAAVLDYLAACGLAYVEDSSNESSDYTRNKLRNHILPEVTAGINSGAVKNILRAGAWIAGADRYLEHQADTWLIEHEQWETGGPGGALLLPAALLTNQDPILKGYIFRRALTELQCPLKDVTAAHIEALCALAVRQTGRRLALPCGVTAWKEYDSVRLFREGTPPESRKKAGTGSGSAEISAQWERRIVPGQILPEGRVEEGALGERIQMDVFSRKNQGEIPKNQCTKWFDYDKIKSTLCLRYRRNGDYITLAQGGHKTLKKYFIDEKIPRQRRDQLLLLAEGNHILWIIGLRISEYYKVTDDTKTILRVQSDGG